MDIAYLGPEGTYTELAAATLVADARLAHATLVPVEGIARLLDELQAGGFYAAAVPVRNTLYGDYSETIAAITKYGLVEISSTDLKIELAIGIHPDSNVARITEIHSKESALAECTEYLTARFPGAKRVPAASTAGAMKEIQAERFLHVAAVGSAIGLMKWGLKEIGRGIENPGDNLTTFLLLARSV